MRQNNEYGMVKAAFVLALSFLSFAATQAGAATTGTVTINGKVPAVCDITVTPEVGASNIADISAGDTNRVVATVNENCNNPLGYTVTVVGTNSTNHTGLFKDSVSNATHPFSITYNNVAVPSGGVVTNANGQGLNLNRTVRITYAANNVLTPTSGFTYSETLTFTIAAK